MIGIAGDIHPMVVGAGVFYRDLTVMAALSLSPFMIEYGFRGPGCLNRLEGLLLLVCYLACTQYLIVSSFTPV